jgi:hypothetical protein
MKLLTLTQYITEKQNFTNSAFSLIMEGGAAGHMMHPFDDNSLTFADFKMFIDRGLQGDLNFEEAPTEKTDGQNLFVTMIDGKVMFARNKGQLSTPLDLIAITSMFVNHQSEAVRDTFTFAAQDLAGSLQRLPAKTQEDFFQNGKAFMNMELIYSGNANVIAYNRDVIQFHGIVTIEDGTTNSKAAKDLAKILQDTNNHVQKTFTIIPPQELNINKIPDFEEKKGYFLDKINALQSKYNLSENEPVSKYHEMWWKDEIEAMFPNVDANLKYGMLMRWAYDDKKTLNVRDIAKQVTPEEKAAFDKFDKEDLKSKQKENIRPFEDIFLELGSTILKNVSNLLALNPSAEAQRLHNQISTEAGKIKTNGDLSQIDKVEKELARLDRIGGIESIMPTEGIVFKYKGKIYKLTGTFAAINQLMGIIKYGR